MNVSRQILTTLALTAASIVPALADTTVTTTTTSANCCRPSVIINSIGQPTIVQSTVSVTPVQLVTTGATITGFTVYRPDDLVVRRDDLLTRIALEQSDGKLSSADAATLINRIQKIDADRAALPRDNSVSYYKNVKKLYSRFDGVANDMQRDSGETEKQLAGNYIVF